MNIKSVPQMGAGPNYTLFTLYENSQPKKKVKLGLQKDNLLGTQRSKCKTTQQKYFYMAGHVRPCDLKVRVD